MTIILTGFPGFETALDAIRRQVDDYLIKPAPIPDLVNLIEEKLRQRMPANTTKLKRIAEILRENKFEITKQALKEMKADPLLGKIPLTDEQRVGQTPQILEELATMLDSNDPNQLPPGITYFAEERGRMRYRLGYSIRLVATHVRLFQRAIHDVLHKNLQWLNLSYFMFDLKRLDDAIGVQLEYTLKAYVEAADTSEASRQG